MKKSETKRIQFIKPSNALLDAFFGALINVSNLSLKPHIFKLLSIAQISALQLGKDFALF